MGNSVDGEGQRGVVIRGRRWRGMEDRGDVASFMLPDCPNDLAYKNVIYLAFPI